MKTSLILIIAIFLNTTLLLAEPAALLVQSLNPWFLVIGEAALVLVYFVNQWFKEFREACTLDLGDLHLFVLKGTIKKV